MSVHISIIYHDDFEMCFYIKLNLFGQMYSTDMLKL